MFDIWIIFDSKCYLDFFHAFYNLYKKVNFLGYFAFIISYLIYIFFLYFIARVHQCQNGNKDLWGYISFLVVLIYALYFLNICSSVLFLYIFLYVFLYKSPILYFDNVCILLYYMYAFSTSTCMFLNVCLIKIYIKKSRLSCKEYFPLHHLSMKLQQEDKCPTVMDTQQAALLQFINPTSITWPIRSDVCGTCSTGMPKHPLHHCTQREYLKTIEIASKLSFHL